MYKAIKNFEVNGNQYKIGENIPNELVSERLIRGKKIEKIDKSDDTEKEILLIDDNSDVKVSEEVIEINEVTEDKPKKSKRK